MSPWKAAQAGRPARARSTRPHSSSTSTPSSATSQRMAAAAARHGRAPARPRQEPQVPGDRAAPGGAGRGGHLLPEGQRGRCLRRRRHPGRAGHQPGDGRRQAAAPGGAGAPRPHRRAGGSRRPGTRPWPPRRAQATSTLDVYVEVNVGANRCGVAPGDDAVRLAQLVADSAPLRFAGLQCYHGPAQHMRTPAGARRGHRQAVRGRAQHARRHRGLRHRGRAASPAPAPAASGTNAIPASSTSSRPAPTSSWTATTPTTGTAADDIAFEHALFVRTTVMSRATPDARGGRRRPQGLQRRLAACRACGSAPTSAT